MKTQPPSPVADIEFPVKTEVKMMSEPIRPEYNTLWKLLQSRLFIIPEYQRAYSWHRQQRNDLFEDITKLLEKGDDRHHFMATIVCLRTPRKETISTDEYHYYEVVDGQQRLTTLILLLKAIGKRLLTEGAKEQKEGQTIEELLVKGDDRLILLQTNHDSRRLFATYLRDGKPPTAADLKTHADHSIASAIQDCEAFVHGLPDALQLLKMVKLRLGFIFHELHESATVYSTFEVLNSRGLAVQSLDKCKSMLMGIAFEQANGKLEVAHHRISELQGYWAELYRTLGTTSVSSSEILRFAATLKSPKTLNRRLRDAQALDLFRELSKDSPRQVALLSNWLLQVTNNLVLLRTNRRLNAVTDISHARLLAVAIMLSEKLTTEQRLRVLNQWERVTFRIFGMVGKDSRTKVGDYTRLAHKVAHEQSGYREMMADLRALGEAYPIDQAVEALRRSNCYEGWDERLRYFLFRFEENLTRQAGVRLNQDRWSQIWSVTAARTVEHIYPQAPTRGSWPRLDNKKAVHWLGNLLLLPPDLNSSASNKPFGDKKALYEQNRLRCMDEVLACSSWGQAEIEVREERLLKWASSEWADLPDE